MGKMIPRILLYPFDFDSVKAWLLGTLVTQKNLAIFRGNFFEHLHFLQATQTSNAGEDRWQKNRYREGKGELTKGQDHRPTCLRCVLVNSYLPLAQALP